MRTALAGIEPAAQVFFSPVSLGAGFWLPKLAEEVSAADAFLLLIGPKGIGPWQEVEYYAAFDRHVGDRRFAVVPVLAADAQAPGLPLLRSLNWVEAPVVTADKALHQLLAALKGETVANAKPLWKLVNPYRGLEAMTEANADYFHGRALETGEVLRALADHPGRCPILIGASGVGKSSVAQAGVLSALKSMRWPGADKKMPWPATLANSRGWVQLTMRPGDAPLAALTAAITRLWLLDARDPDQAALPRKWAERLRSGDNTLAELIGATQEELKKREGEAPARILLYIDQGEELYTRAASAEAHRFSKVVAEGLGDGRLSVFASLRADYFDRLQADEALFKSYQHINVAPLDRARLNDVVTAPARALGVAFEDDRTAERITISAAAEPGALPLLSYLLTDMWDGMVKRGDATLRLPAQAIDIGGVLASRAEEFLEANPESETALRRLLTLRLASVPPEGEPVRRGTHREECTEAEWALAARLAEYPWRLVVTSEREANGEIVAEVAHEALLRAWPRLSSWLREEREFLILKGDAERAQKRWRVMGMADKALLAGLDLTRAEEWLPKRSDGLSPEVRTFVQRSIAADRTQKQRQLRIQRMVSLGAVAAASLMTIIGAFAWLEWGEAVIQGDRAVLQGELARLVFINTQMSTLQKETDSKQTFLSQVKRSEMNAQRDNPGRVPELRNQIRAVAEDRERMLGQVAVLAADQNNTIAEIAADNTKRWNNETVGRREQIIANVLQTVTSDKELSAQSRLRIALFAVAAIPESEARLNDALRGAILGYRLRTRFSPPGSQQVWAVAFNPRNEHQAAVGDELGTVWLWDPLGNSPSARSVLSAAGDIVNGLAFNAEGRLLAAAYRTSGAVVWQLGTGNELCPLERRSPPAATRLLTASAVVGGTYGVAFAPGGRTLAVAAGRSAQLWDLTKPGCPTLPQVFQHNDEVFGVAFSPDGNLLATASSDGSVAVWKLDRPGEPLRRFPTGNLPTRNPMYAVAFSPTGTALVASSGADGRGYVWDVETGQQIDLPTQGGTVGQIAFSADGALVVATASANGTAFVSNASTGMVLDQLGGGGQSPMFGGAFSPDSKYLLTGNLDGIARLWAVGDIEVAANGREALIALGAHRITNTSLTPDECNKLRAMDIPIFALADRGFEKERSFICPLPFLGSRPDGAE